MSPAARPRPVAGLAVVCRSFPDNALHTAASEWLELLPALAALGTRVDVVSASGDGRDDHRRWRGVRLHRLGLPEPGDLPPYVGAGLWAQAAAGRVEGLIAQGSAGVVEAPLHGAEGLHCERLSVRLIVARSAAGPRETGGDPADLGVRALMEAEAAAAAGLRVSGAPAAGHLCVPVVRVGPPPPRHGDGPIVVLPPPGWTDAHGYLGALPAGIRRTVLAGLDLDARADRDLGEAAAVHSSRGASVVASVVSTTSALAAYLRVASLIVLPRGADGRAAVDALAWGVPVLAQDPALAAALDDPGGLRIAPHLDAPALCARSLELADDADLHGVARNQAREVLDRHAPARAAAKLLSAYRAHAEAVSPDRVPTGRRAFRFPQGRAPVAIAVAADGPGRRTVGALRGAGARVAVTVIGDGPVEPMEVGDLTRSSGPPPTVVDDLLAVAAEGAESVVVASLAPLEFAPGWDLALLDRFAAAPGLGLVGPAGYRLAAASGGGHELVACRRGDRPADVLLGGPVIAAPGALAAGAPPPGTSDLVLDLRRSLEARRRGFRIQQGHALGVRTQEHVALPGRVPVPPEAARALQALGLVLEAAVLELGWGEGFHEAERQDLREFAWMADQAELLVRAPVAGTWELTADCGAFARDRTLAVTGPGGRELPALTVPASRTGRLSVLLDLPAGESTVLLRSEPPAERPVDLGAIGDHRRLGVRLYEPVMERVQ